MSTNIDEGAPNDDALESSEDVSSSVFQADEDHIKSAPNNDSFFDEEIIRNQMKLQDIWRYTIKHGKRFMDWKGIQKELQVQVMARLHRWL